jgi:protein TonB
VPPPPPPPPPPAPPQNVAPTVLEQRRIAGDRAITPDDATRRAIADAGKTKVVGAWKLCISETGAVTTVRALKSTGFPAYDAALEAGMRAWRYRPFRVNGNAAKVCTAVTFIYNQQAAPTSP